MLEDVSEMVKSKESTAYSTMKSVDISMLA